MFSKPNFIEEKKKRLFSQAMEDIKLELTSDLGLPSLLRVIRTKKVGAFALSFPVVNPAIVNVDVNSNQSMDVNRNTSRLIK